MAIERYIIVSKIKQNETYSGTGISFYDTAITRITKEDKFWHYECLKLAELSNPRSKKEIYNFDSVESFIIGDYIENDELRDTYSCINHEENDEILSGCLVVYNQLKAEEIKHDAAEQHSRNVKLTLITIGLVLLFVGVIVAILCIKYLH